MSRTEPAVGITPALDDARKADHDYVKAIHNLELVTARKPEGSLSGWASAAVAALFTVREALGAHIAVTDAPGGLFEESLERAPRLSHQVQTLRQDGKALEGAIADTLVALTDPGADGPTLVARLTDLLRVIRAHRKKESDLVYEAYQVDIGSEA